MADIVGRIIDERMVRKYSHYQGYKWACLLMVILLPVLNYYFGMVEDGTAIGLKMGLFAVTALLFHEKMKHAQTIRRLRGRLEQQGYSEATLLVK